MAKNETIHGDKLLKLVQAIAISPEDAKAVATKHFDQAKRGRGKSPSTPSDEEARSTAADAIIARYSSLAALVGGASGLSGVVPGIGTILAATGGAAADTAASMKLQVDMCHVLVHLYEATPTNEDRMHLALLLAAGAAVEKVGGDVAIRFASKAGVKMLKTYLRGATLQVVKELFKKLGIAFTRKALEKALPLGVGVVVGAGFNKGLTAYVGKSAKRALELYPTD